MTIGPTKGQKTGLTTGPVTLTASTLPQSLLKAPSSNHLDAALQSNIFGFIMSVVKKGTWDQKYEKKKIDGGDKIMGQIKLHAPCQENFGQGK